MTELRAFELMVRMGWPRAIIAACLGCTVAKVNKALKKRGWYKP